jgi:hypothetical protein
MGGSFYPALVVLEIFELLITLSPIASESELSLSLGSEVKKCESITSETWSIVMERALMPAFEIDLFEFVQLASSAGRSFRVWLSQ